MRLPPRGQRACSAALALLLALGAWALAAGCERSRAPAPPPVPAPPAAGAQPAAAPPFARPPPGDAAAAPVILLLGDRRTAGFGLPSEEAFPAVIQERLRAAGSPWRVVNAGVSGDTSAGGLSRLDWLLKQRVDVLLLALGANDGLRGQHPAAIRANLARIIERAQARGITVILAGMRMPANYGADYARQFHAIFPELAERYRVAFIPFLLEGVAMQPELNQVDGIHPNAAGARTVADTVWRALKPLLERP